MAGDANGDAGGLIAGINVTPLVDVTLVLLIIFIVTARVVAQPAVPLDLPRATTSEEVATILSVILDRDGRTLVNGQVTADGAALTAAARAALAEDPSVRAVISASGEVPHRRVLGALDALRAGGLAHVAFGALPEPGP